MFGEKNWRTLLTWIKRGECTPFLGAGACSGVLPLGSDLARELAQEYKYPLKSSDDLIRVTQFIAVDYHDWQFPKHMIQERLKKVTPPDFRLDERGFPKDPCEPHGLLADLRLPIYITTNYDDFMVQALRSRKREPKREICRWNERIESQASVFGSEYSPTVEHPVVFHLHGYTEALESMVLTVDDYVDFLISISRNPNLLPPRIQEAFASTSLLFFGYRLADWNFLVLFRTLVTYLSISNSVSHVSVQLSPRGETASEEEKEQAERYFEEYYGMFNIHVYWGSCRDFAHELRTRWDREGS